MKCSNERKSYRYIIVNGQRYARQVWPLGESWQTWLTSHFPKGKYIIQLEKLRPGEFCRPFTCYI
jgi:hypothetical protein